MISEYTRIFNSGISKTKMKLEIKQDTYRDTNNGFIFKNENTHSQIVTGTYKFTVHIFYFFSLNSPFEVHIYH